MLTLDVCRLCLSEENLMCVFDKRLEKTDHMKEVILITTGVEIHSKDVISQKICTKCGRDAIKMFQFRQQSLKNDRYLKAQCRELLKHTDMKIPNTNVTIKKERIDKEEIKQEPLRKPPYKVHPTMTALSRKYPQMQFPSTCLLYNVDPCISMEMDTVENYFRNKKINMRKCVQVALKASNEAVPKKTSTITKSSIKSVENCAKNRQADHVAQSTSTTISKTVEVVDKISPINIKRNHSSYAIVRPSTESFIQCEIKNDCESTISSIKLITGCPNSQSGISESKKRKLPDNDSLSEPETKKVPSTNPSNTTPVQMSVEKTSRSVFKCSICNSFEFSAKHLLKKHQIEHSRCNFCKILFKSVGMKQQHITSSCLVKEALNNKPDVEVERVELNMNVRLQHQEAFTKFPPLPGSEKMSSTSKSTDTAEESIEVISDNEDTSVSTLSIKPVCSNHSSHTTSTVTKSLHEKPPLPLVIRPDVRMKNDSVLDSLKRQTPDIEIVKELLTKFRKLQSVTDEATQTKLPMTESIRIKRGHLVAELVNLKHILHSYRIPVEIRKGPVNALYNYQPTPSRPKILKLWNDLTPIDLNTENNPVTEHVIVDITETHSNSTNKGPNSQDSSNNNQASLQNIEMVLPESSHSCSSDSLKRKSPIISTQTESLQTKSKTFISTQSSFNTKMEIGRKLLDSPHSNSNLPEVFPVQAKSSIGDSLIRRHSSYSSGTVQTTPHIEIFPSETTCSIPSTPRGRNSSGVDQTTLQNNFYINSKSRIKSPVQNKSDLNASWNPLNTQSEAMDCTTKTRQELTDRVIDHIFIKSSECVDPGKINEPSPNGVINSNNNKKQPRPRISKASKSMRNNIKRDKNVRHVPATTNSRNNGHSSNGNNTPIPKTLNDNDVFIEPPPPYPNGSILFNQTTQSYISSHTNTHAAENPRNGYHNALHQYLSQLQEVGPYQKMARAAATFYPEVHDVGHHDAIGYFAPTYPLRNSPENLSILQVSKSFGYNGDESTFPHYSFPSNYLNASVTVDAVNQSCNISNRQLPNATYTESSNFATTIPPPDKSKHCASGMIRVKNVSELT